MRSFLLIQASLAAELKLLPTALCWTGHFNLLLAMTARFCQGIIEHVVTDAVCCQWLLRMSDGMCQFIDCL